VIKKKEIYMMNTEKKVFKVEEEWAEGIFSLKCSEVAWEADNKDQRKENLFNMSSNALLKKSIMERAQKFRLQEINFAQNVMEKEEKMVPTLHVLDAKEEVFKQN